MGAVPIRTTTPADYMDLLTFRLLASVKPRRKISQSCAQKYASYVILDPIKLAININYHKEPPGVLNASRSLPKSHLHHFQSPLTFMLNTVLYLLSCYGNLSSNPTVQAS